MMNNEKEKDAIDASKLDEILPKYDPLKLNSINLAQNYVSAFNTGMNIYQCVNQLQGYIEWVVKAVNDVVKSWNVQVGESIDQSKAIVRETTTEQFNTEWTNKQPELIEQVNTLTTNQFNEDWGILENRINTTLETQNTNIQNIQNEQNELVTNTNNNISEQNTKINSIQTQQNNLASNQTNLANQQTTLSNRMDTFTSLSEGSTTGDAELQDIRVGANGTTYDTAGNAVRGQYSQLGETVKELRNRFYEFPKIEDYENKYAYSLSDGKPKWESSNSFRTCSIDGDINIKAYFTNAVDDFNVSIYLVTVTKFENEVYSTKTFNVNNLFLYNTSKNGTVYGISYEIDVGKRAVQFTGSSNNVTLSITMAKNSGYVENIKRYRPKWLISKPNEIYVCASDSTNEEKEYADYLCDGVNDEVEIMKAIKKLNPYGAVVLSSGKFNIQSFSRYRENDVKCAIFSDKDITIQGSGRYRTKLFVSNDTLSTLTEKVAIVSGYDTCINLNDLSFELENHNHPCICYYGANLSRGNLTNVSAKASANDNTATIDIPNENCIAFVSYHGDDAGTNTIWESLFACGFYRAFQLGAEHHILKQCTGRYNYCTFTFGEYEVKLGNAFSHPITLINCADEHQCLLPQFYKCGAMVNEDTEGHPLQEVDFISFNIERWNDWSEHQMCAKEVNAGDFCGIIEYTMNGVTPSAYEEWTSTKNLKHAKFWEKGSGVNFITRNMTHRLGGTTELRNTYYPNYMQEYYDTDLKKKLIYDGINWVDLNGTVIN